MIEVLRNDEKIQVDDKTTLQQALTAWNYQQSFIAVAINANFVAKHLYKTTILNHGDRIEIVSPMQGG